MTQTQQVIEQLRSGSVSRNWALERRITRLGAIVCDLKKQEKYRKIEGKFEPTDYGQDYIYRLPNAELKRKVENARSYVDSIDLKGKDTDFFRKVQGFKEGLKRCDKELEKVNPQGYVINRELDIIRNFKQTYG